MCIYISRATPYYSKKLQFGNETMKPLAPRVLHYTCFQLHVQTHQEDYCQCALWYGVIVFLQHFTTIYWILGFSVWCLFHQGQMRYLAMSAKVKNNPYIHLLKYMGSSLAHDTPFHQVWWKLGQ